MTGRHAPTPRGTVDYEEAEARAEAREKRENRRREYQPPLHNRETAKARPEDQQLDLRGDWQHNIGDMPRAWLAIERYRYGFEIGGRATAEQLVEMRDALNAHIDEKLREASDE